MKQILYISIFLFSVLSFGQEITIKNKRIRGFIFEDISYVKTQIPVFEADILIKETERKTKTDKDGNFQIEAKEGDELIIRVLGYKDQIILITDKNCYNIYLSKIDFDVWQSRKTFRKNSRYYRKIEKEVLRNRKNGNYDCTD